ncbi:MAG: InlB B-repeat-containing protein [Firmicutes bacterium]|nr:InlB B-repeat-containing protein [Bacillota bacterium]
MTTPTRKFRHSRIAALAFAGVFVVCAVVIGIVFSMNKSDDGVDANIVYSDNHFPFPSITNMHMSTRSTYGINTRLASLPNAGVWVGQMHVSAPTTTIETVTDARSLLHNFEIRNGTIRRTERIVTFPEGISAITAHWFDDLNHILQHSQRHSALGAGVHGVPGSGIFANAGALTNIGAANNLYRRTMSVASQSTTVIMRQVTFVGEQREIFIDYYTGLPTWSSWQDSTTVGWNPWPTHGGISGFGDHGVQIATSPTVSEVQTFDLDPNITPFSSSFRLWETNARVPLVANVVNAPAFANQTSFAPWVQTRVISQDNTNMNIQISLTNDAPFGMYLNGAFLQTTGNVDSPPVHANQVNQRTRSLIVQMPQTLWNNSWGAINLGHPFVQVFIGMYYNAADNTAPTRPVTFNLQGGNFAGDESDHIIHVTSTAQLHRPDPNPTREGYTFRHWSSVIGGGQFVFPVVITSNNTINAANTLYAVWGRNPTITFNTHGGSNVPDQVINWGGTITRPNDPTRFGYHFSHWSNVENGVTHWNFNNAVTTNMELHAVFDFSIWLTLQLHIGNPLNDTSMTITVRNPENTVMQLGNFVPGHIDLDFLGWALSPEAARNKQIFRQPNGTIQFDPEGMFQNNNTFTMYAVWDIEWENFPGIDGHNIMTFNFSGGINPHATIVEQRQYFAWDPSSRLLPTHEYMHSFAQRNPDFHGLTFIGWYNNPSFMGQRYFSIPSESSGERSFYARWVLI